MKNGTEKHVYIHEFPLLLNRQIN